MALLQKSKNTIIFYKGREEAASLNEEQISKEEVEVLYVKIKYRHPFNLVLENEFK